MLKHHLQNTGAHSAAQMQGRVPWGGQGCGEDSGVKRSDVAYLAWPGPEPSSHLLGLLENHHSGTLAHGLNVAQAMLSK